MKIDGVTWKEVLATNNPIWEQEAEKLAEKSISSVVVSFDVAEQLCGVHSAIHYDSWFIGGLVYCFSGACRHRRTERGYQYYLRHDAVLPVDPVIAKRGMADPIDWRRTLDFRLETLDFRL